LRKSVKLKKRANPLEKIITKLIIQENEEITTPSFAKQISQRNSEINNLNSNGNSTSNTPN